MRLEHCECFEANDQKNLFLDSQEITGCYEQIGVFRRVLRPGLRLWAHFDGENMVV